MTTDPNTASIAQCRDWIAENVLGWRIEGKEWHRGEFPDPIGCLDILSGGLHPLGPDRSTDAAIAAMPKGWFVELKKGSEGRCWGYAMNPKIGASDDILPSSDGLPTTAWRLCLAMHIAEGRGK